MGSLTRSHAHSQISGLIYSEGAALLLSGLLLVFIYPFSFLISGVDPTLPIEGQSQNKIVYYLQVVLPFCCLAFALLYRGLDISLPAITMIYPIVCLASTIWSFDPYDTFKEASLLLLYILAVAAVCQIVDIEVFCKIVVRVLAFLILASVVMAVALPQYGTHQLDDALGDAHAGLWRGVFGHKNQLGAAASTSVFIFLLFRRLISASIGFQVMCIVAAIACLIFAESAGSWVALCMLAVYYFLLRSAPVSRNVLMLIVFGVSALAFTVFSFYSAGLAVIVGRDATFTGRADIWRIVLDAIWQKPLLGFGYYAGTHDFMKPVLQGQLFSAAVDPHNGYFDVMLGTGAIGLILLLCCIVSVLVTGIDCAKRSAGPESDFFWLLLTFPILSLLFSFFETSGLSGVHDLLDALTFLSLTAIPSYWGPNRVTRQPPMSAAPSGQRREGRAGIRA